ncbi:hypothetical protein D3C72_2521020 [compost metagenome]
MESLTTGFIIKTELNPNGAGEGELLAAIGRAKPEKVGTVRYDADGVATITFKDGTTTKARLF